MSAIYHARPVSWLVHREGNPSIYSSSAFVVQIDDEGDGEYVRLKAHEGQCEANETSFEAEAWETIKAVVDLAVQEIQRHEKEPTNG